MYIFILSILVCLVIIIIIIVCISKSSQKNEKLQKTDKNESIYVFLYAQDEFNIKSHDLLKYFRQKFIVSEKNETTVENTIDFIKKNQQENYILLFYSCQRHLEYELKMMSYLDTLTNLKLKSVFFTFDYWLRPLKIYQDLWMNVS